MEVKLTSEALKDKEELSESGWKEVKNKIREAVDSFEHKDLKLVPNPFLKHPIWQLKTEIETGKSYRIYTDIKNRKAVVLAIWNFEFTHNGNQHWKELEKRM